MITGHDIDLATTAAYKEALWEVQHNCSDPILPQSLSTKNVSHVHSRRSLNQNLKEVKSTSLMGFRDFTFESAIETGIKKNVQAQVRTVLDKQSHKKIKDVRH